MSNRHLKEMGGVQTLLRKQLWVGKGPQKSALQVTSKILKKKKNQGFVWDTMRDPWMDFEQFNDH